MKVTSSDVGIEIAVMSVAGALAGCLALLALVAGQAVRHRQRVRLQDDGGRRTAEPRPLFAAEHVPGLELRLAKALGVALRAWH